MKGCEFCLSGWPFLKCQAGLEWRLSSPRRIRNILQQIYTTGPGYTCSQTWMWLSWLQTCGCNPVNLSWFIHLGWKIQLPSASLHWHQQNLSLSGLGSAVHQKDPVLICFLPVKLDQKESEIEQPGIRKAQFLKSVLNPFQHIKHYTSSPQLNTRCWDESSHQENNADTLVSPCTQCVDDLRLHFINWGF